jgi:hypothetical protein
MKVFLALILTVFIVGTAQAQAPSAPCPSNLFQWVAPTATAQGYYECVAAPAPVYTPPQVYVPPPVYYPPYYPRPWDHPNGPGH